MRTGIFINAVLPLSFIFNGIFMMFLLMSEKEYVKQCSTGADRSRIEIVLPIRTVDCFVAKSTRWLFGSHIEHDADLLKISIKMREKK